MSAYFYMGNKDKVESLADDEKLSFIRGKLAELFEMTNLSFLLGAGCSSHLNEAGIEVSIPTMDELAKEFNDSASKNTKDIISKYGEGKTENLEKFLSYLYQKKLSLHSEKDDAKKTKAAQVELLEKAIIETKKFIYEKCKKRDSSVNSSYETLYKKLLLRSDVLPRVNIMTTNYDLYNEIAMDQLGVIYSNGFSGFIERRFNPAIFKYSLYTQMDLKERPLAQIDNFIFLYKLHGSINWVKDDSDQNLFEVREIQEPKSVKDEVMSNMMIYPSPQKQSDTFGVPYSDLFREFQGILNLKNGVLIVVGYGFGDDHVNNIIFRALTLATFRVVIIGSPEKPIIKKLKELDDSRIWIIGGEENSSKSKLHYFKGFVNQILPDMQQDEIDKQIQKTKMGLVDLSSSIEDIT